MFFNVLLYLKPLYFVWYKMETNKDSSCGSQQWFLALLKMYLTTEAKSYVVIQFAYMIKNYYEPSDYNWEVSDVTSNFQARIDSIVLAIKKYTVSREVWENKTETHIEGKTFVSFSNLTRGYVLNEILLNAGHQCNDDCEGMSNSVYRIQCGSDKWCQRSAPICNKILKCQKLDSELDVCLGDQNKRRYEYIQQGNGTRFGPNNATCKKLYHLTSYRQNLLRTCSYCFCLCDEGAKFYSDRFINLRSVMANIKDNRVVTGIRFVKHNRIIHLQIQEGKVLPYGLIDKNDVRWVPVEDYKITNFYIYEGQDYHTLSWSNRGMFLQSLMTKPGFVLTGVRFNKLKGNVYLEIIATPFNFTTGKLEHLKSISQNNISLISKRKKEFRFSKADVPTKANLRSFHPDFSSNYIEFTHTDFEKDAAQTTIPFFDAQNVTLDTPTLLVGVGIFYKGNEEFGGFVAPKIYTYDYSQHLHPSFF